MPNIHGFSTFRYHQNYYIWLKDKTPVKKTLLAIISAVALPLQAQQDSITINGTFTDQRKTLRIQQELIYHNNTSQSMDYVKLLNWSAAYTRKESPLAQRKIEDRNRELYFSKSYQRGRLMDVNVQKDGQSLTINGTTAEENLYVQLTNALQPGEKVTLNLEYEVQLPQKKFTGYGNGEGHTMLKYFFLVPDTFHPTNNRSYYDVEEKANAGSYWDIKLNAPSDFQMVSNLSTVEQNHFRGMLNSDPEIYLADTPATVFKTEVDKQPIAITFEYPIPEEHKSLMEFYIPLQLKFLKNRLGELPDHLLISEKFYRKNNFVGISDLNFWRFHYQLFSNAEQVDLNYFSVLSTKLIEQLYRSDKQDDHWLTNGLKTYLEIQYIQSVYKDSKLLGQLPEQFKILGTKPLKSFHASDLKLIDRYSLAYQYIMTQNLDQKITTPYTELSKFNDMAISQFEAGALLNYTAQHIGVNKFNAFLKNYLDSRRNEHINPTEFLKQLAELEPSTTYLNEFISRKNRINFKLEKYKKVDNEYEIKVSKNTSLPIPLRLETENNNGEKKTYWFNTKNEKGSETFRIPEGDAAKIVLNDDYLFPEANFRDNYLYTKGLFANMKKVKLKLFKDVPNPEYNEIYLNPRFSFNVYDKFLLGINLKNESFFDQKFTYSLTPYYSTGTSQLTGSSALAYHIMPADSFFRKLSFGLSGTYLHYDYDLAYRKVTASATMDFTKRARSMVGRNLTFAYNYYQKDLSPKMIADNEYDKYNLWTLRYAYSDNSLIHEKNLTLGGQYMKDFSKISAEAFYRWEYANNKKISFRWFAGVFTHNKTKDDIFNYGLSNVSDYSFSYGLLGQSATTGFLSQQYVLAEGGFKSLFKDNVNQWLTSVNVDAHIWKMFNLYADAGVYKNKNISSQFIWDSGVKLKIVPDFIEVYFPVQSSLGFEPGMKNYAQRIRFTFVLSLGAVVNQLRRGLY